MISNPVCVYAFLYSPFCLNYYIIFETKSAIALYCYLCELVILKRYGYGYSGSTEVVKEELEKLYP